jgi:hypothetical protein
MKIYCVVETDGYEDLGRTFFAKRADAYAYKAQADKGESIVAGYWFTVIYKYDLNETFDPTVA